MSATIRLTIENIVEVIASYDEIQLHRGDTVEGVYSQAEVKALVANQFYYTIIDLTGDINRWYKYRFHNTVTAAVSDFSDPFRVDGVSRLRIRQSALERYGKGLILVASAGAVGSLTSPDYRVKSSGHSTARGSGTWVLPTTGAMAGQARLVTTIDRDTGQFTVSPVWSGSPGTDEFEWHFAADPNDWNDAIVRAALRYNYIDRVPFNGIKDQDEYDLSFLPWLIHPRQILDLRYYPQRKDGVDNGTDEPWGVGGRWWRPRMDSGAIFLRISPTVQNTTLFYLVGYRPMPALYTDASMAPSVCSESLMVALTFDELCQKKVYEGTSESREVWFRERTSNIPKLRSLHRRYSVFYDLSPTQLEFRPVVPTPFKG